MFSTGSAAPGCIGYRLINFIDFCMGFGLSRIHIASETERLQTVPFVKPLFVHEERIRLW